MNTQESTVVFLVVVVVVWSNGLERISFFQG
jgi:hypothetical protein